MNEYNYKMSISLNNSRNFIDKSKQSKINKPSITKRERESSRLYVIMRVVITNRPNSTTIKQVVVDTTHYYLILMLDEEESLYNSDFYLL